MQIPVHIAQSKADTGLYTAAQLAAALKISKRNTRKALADVQPSGTLPINGNAAPVWTVDTLPEKLRAAIAARAGKVKLSMADYLDTACKPWKLEIPLAQIAESSLAEAHTSLGERVHDALDYTLQTGSMSLIEGPARFGKSHSAVDWCERHPGRARYVQLDSSRDEMSFYRAIAKALGVSINLNSKAQELRQRVEETLQGGDLVIVIDEAHYLWPNLIDSRTLPARINWILTALVNKGVPLALVTTPQFLRNQKEFETRTRWTSEQLTGRIGHYEPLPDTLTLDDLRKVAVALAPGADEKTVETLVHYANGSLKYLAGIRHAVDRAGFIARKEGSEKIQFADVKRALKEAVIPSDTAFANAVADTKNPARKRAARVFATPLQPASRALESPLPVERIARRSRDPYSGATPEISAIAEPQSRRSLRPATAGAVEETELVHA